MASRAARRRRPRAIAIGVIALLVPVSGCSTALTKEEIGRFEGFGGNAGDERALAEARALVASGQARRALEICTRLRERHPGNVLVHRAYQDCRVALGERADLLAEYEALARSNPSAVHEVLLSRLQTDPEAGAYHARRAFEQDDRQPWAWYAYGWWCGRMGTDRQRAEAALRRALDLYPNFFPALRAYAVMLRSSDPRAAAEAIQSYVQAYPGRRERFLLASLRLGLGQDEVVLAEREFRQLLEEEPGDAECAKGLASALLELDRNEEAKAIYRGLLRSHPEDPSPEFNLAIVAEAEGRLEEAREHYQRYLDKGAEQPFLLQSRARLFLQDLDEKLGPATREARLP